MFLMFPDQLPHKSKVIVKGLAHYRQVRLSMTATSGIFGPISCFTGMGLDVYPGIFLM